MIKKLLGIPGKKRVALLISLGYPVDAHPKPKVRKTVADMSSIFFTSSGDAGFFS